MNNKKIILIGLILITLTSFVLAEYYTYNNCMVWDATNNDIVAPTFVDLDNQGSYEYFKPIARPKPIQGLKPDVQVAYVTGTNLEDLRCN